MHTVCTALVILYTDILSKRFTIKNSKDTKNRKKKYFGVCCKKENSMVIEEPCRMGYGNYISTVFAIKCYIF